MRDRDFLAERFEEERPQLRRIAYRMLGTVDEADDAVQEAWIRLSRARRRVQGAKPVPDVELAEQKRVVEAFLAAAREGDFDALLEMLDPDVILRVDAGPGGKLAREPVVGAKDVLAEASRFTALARYTRPAVVNGVAGAVIG